MQIFGSILGYLLWGLFYVFQNFGISIILFTIVVKLIMFPFSVKQQKSMAKTTALQKKQREIQQKYANDKQKMNEEMQKLYQKEGVSPTGGCLTSIIPILLMLGIFYSVAYPLTNTLHIGSESVNSALEYIKTIPGYSVSQGLTETTRAYNELNFIRIISEAPTLYSDVSGLFTAVDIEKINMFVKGFDFGGFNLLTTPQSQGLFSVYIIIPALCLITNYSSQFITMKISGSMQNQQGCMKFTMYLLPLMTVWFAYIVPSAVGFYWICSSIFALLQSLIMAKFYSPALLTAKSEAQHVALMEQNEANVQYAYAPLSNSKNKKK